jgi:hypothetical protein
MSRSVRIFLLVLFAVNLTGCASLRTGLGFLFSDFNGDKIALDAPKVEAFIQKVAQNSDKYVIAAYQRRALSWKMPKTRLFQHEYFVITEPSGSFHTLSFSGTKRLFTSPGYWLEDGRTDRNSYLLFLRGDNKWEVVSVTPQARINTHATALKILQMMAEKPKYYYRTHIKAKAGCENCITALRKVMTENGSG